MLAYQFWHWPRAEVSLDVYERHLIAFHDALQQNPSPGFLGSNCYRTERPSWLPQGTQPYLDLYGLENSAALDALNEAAVSAECLETHNAAAALADGGTGGLYAFKAGSPDFSEALVSYWLGKPEGWSCSQLYHSLAPVCEKDKASLWGRRMVLGTSPEFCLFSPQPMALLFPVAAETVPMNRIFPA
jgi:hypothetical protein